MNNNTRAKGVRLTLKDIERTAIPSVGFERWISPFEKKEKSMANSKAMVPEAKEALDRFKMEAASEVGVTLKQGYNGDITAKQAGSVGGQMVKKMIESYEKGL